jgi:plasmid replication initiation protein
MPIMSIEAVGGYLRALVLAQPDLSYASVCRAAGVKTNYLSRLGIGGKNSTKEPSARVLLKLVRAARGRIEDLEQLLYSETATIEEGRKLGESTAAALRAAPNEDARRQVLERLIADLEANPQKLDQLIGYGSRLIEEDRRREGR